MRSPDEGRVSPVEVLRVPPTPAVRRWSRDHGFAAELVARWGAFYEDLPGLLRALEAPPPQFVRPNPLRADPSRTLARLEAKGFQLKESGVPGTYRVAEAPFSAGATEEYLSGHYQLQDAASALAPLALEAEAGDVVADLCAAPGGKTIQTAALRGDRGVLLAFESDPARARALRSNLDRCGVASCAVWARPAQDAARLGVTADRVLLDAPCTGEGVIPRDAHRRLGQLHEYEACARTQAELLETAHAILRPGGILVYSTCTLAPEENELQVDRALRELGFTAEPLPDAVRGLRLGGRPLAPALERAGPRDLHPGVAHAAHALPHLHGCLGFFLARLRKEAS